jgi:hypothetical protein
MALFGEARDISMFRHVNRELMGNIISQQCSFFKLRLGQTQFNMYGEASGDKFYDGPILLYALIANPSQTWSTDDMGVNFNFAPTFRFLRDDLLNKLQDFNEDSIYGANLVPQVGDIIYYQTAYFEVNSTNANQFFVGKDPDYTNSVQPTGWNPGLENFGYNTSIICNTHYVPADKVGITKERT